MGTVISAFNEGGVFMYVILAFGILTLGLCVDRAISLFVKLEESPKGFRQQILDHLARGDFKSAETAAQSLAGATPLGRVVATGCRVKAKGGGDEELQARMDERLNQEITSIDRGTSFLAMFGNVSTLLGLLGTITGMIHAFAAVAAASPVERAAMLSRGIAEAMNCTAFGLIVAIPALVAYAVFQNKTDRYVTALTEETTEIYNDLVFLTESEPAVSPSSKTQTRNRLHPTPPTVSV